MILVVFFSCEKDTNYECVAIIVSNVNSATIQCDKDVYDLKFIEGEDRVKSVIDYEYNNHSIYAVLDLPDELKTIGLTIKLDIRETQPDERPSCYNFEMPILLGPIVSVVRAEKTNSS